MPRISGSSAFSRASASSWASAARQASAAWLLGSQNGARSLDFFPALPDLLQCFSPMISSAIHPRYAIERVQRDGGGARDQHPRNSENLAANFHPATPRLDGIPAEVSVSRPAFGQCGRRSRSDKIAASETGSAGTS
jgi:hypothetical protein